MQDLEKAGGRMGDKELGLDDYRWRVKCWGLAVASDASNWAAVWIEFLMQTASNFLVRGNHLQLPPWHAALQPLCTCDCLEYENNINNHHYEVGTWLAV